MIEREIRFAFADEFSGCQPRREYGFPSSRKKGACFFYSAILG
jgi:hypothetical protein